MLSFISCALPDGLLIIVKTSAEGSRSASPDLVLLEWVIYILNIAIFALPIVYSLIQDVYSYVAESVSGGKYSSEEIPPREDQVRYSQRALYSRNAV